MKYNWDAKRYRELVEGTSNPWLKRYMELGLSFIVDNINNPKAKTFIGVGAGYGRAIPKLSAITRNFIAIEINKDMLIELTETVSQYDNVSVIGGNAENLTSLLNDLDINKPVLLSLQNSLGTPEGDPNKIMSEMFNFAFNNKGEVIISLFIQEGLEKFGLSIYNSVSELTGKPDLYKTDFDNGDLISETGYKSHWWKKEEIDNIIKTSGGKLLNELRESYFHILHIGFE